MTSLWSYYCIHHIKNTTWAMLSNVTVMSDLMCLDRSDSLSTKIKSVMMMMMMMSERRSDPSRLIQAVSDIDSGCSVHGHRLWSMYGVQTMHLKSALIDQWNIKLFRINLCKLIMHLIIMFDVFFYAWCVGL